MLRQLLDQAVSMAVPQDWPTFDGKILDRSEFLTSSEVASCLRQTYFNKQHAISGGKGFSGNGYTERGHAIEAWLVEKLKPLEQHGFKLEYMGSDQRSFYDADLGLSGTPDGLLTLPDGKKYLLEIKSIDPRTNKRNLPKTKHKWQVQQNMYLMQKCLDIKLEGAILFYVDASNVYDCDEFFFTYDPTVIEACVDRGNQLWNAREADDLDPEGLYNGDCDLCPFTGPCSATIDMQKALAASGSAAGNFSASELPPSVGDTLLSEEDAETVHDFIYSRREMKEFESQVEELKPLVSKLVVGRNGLFVFEDHVLTAVETPGRETVDKEKMKRDGLDIERYLKTGKPFVTLKVKEPK